MWARGPPLPRLADEAAPVAQAITIQLDYSYDTNGFFDQPGAKEALRAATDYYEALLRDDLAAILPGGGNSWTALTTNPATGGDLDIDNLVVLEAGWPGTGRCCA